MLAGVDGYICTQEQISSFLQLFGGNTSNGTEETIWTHERIIDIQKLMWSFVRIT